MLGGEHLDNESSSICQDIFDLIEELEGSTGRFGSIEVQLLLDEFLTILRGLVKKFVRLIENSSKVQKFGFYQSSSFGLLPTELYVDSDGYEDLIDITIVNVKLAEIDLRLSASNNEIVDWLLQHEELLRSEPSYDRIPSIRELTHKKILFLLKKVQLRYAHDLMQDEEKMGYENSSLLLNRRNLLLSEIDYTSLYISELKGWLDLITNHYSVSLDGRKSAYIFENDQELIEILGKEIREEDLSYYQLYRLIKCHKDVKRHPDKLRQLYKIFRNTRASRVIGMSRYDEGVDQLFDQYFTNNLYSLTTAQNPNGQVPPEVSYGSSIGHIFFPYQKKCENILIPELKSLVGNFDKKEDLNLEKFDNLLRELKKEAHRCRLAFDWCFERDFLHVALPKGESMISLANGKLHIASRHILPLDYDQRKSRIDQIDDQIRWFEQEKDYITRRLNLLKNLEGHSIRSIEILGIFAAIGFFAGGSLQLLKSDNISFEKGLAFIGIVGSIMIVFLYFVLVLSARGGDFKRRANLFWIPVVVLILTIVLLGISD